MDAVHRLVAGVIIALSGAGARGAETDAAGAYTVPDLMPLS